jgi:hypothetical protein
MLKDQKGQALLIVVLVMVVALTVGLSVASRSITNLKTTQDQANSQKALAAAEAGVERVLDNQNLPEIAQTKLGANSEINYKTEITHASGTGKFLLNGGIQIDKNVHVNIWPAKTSETDLYGSGGGGYNGTITLYWGENGGDGCSDAALEVTVISGTPISNLTITRYAYDPCSTRRGNNNFIDAAVRQDNSVGAVMLRYKVVLPSIANARLFNISPLYVDNTYIGASANVNIPEQGTNITSTGTSESQVKRRINAFKGLPQIPAELFPFTIFSP